MSSKIYFKLSVYSFLILSSVFLIAGCASSPPVYEANFNIDNHPQMAPSIALLKLGEVLQKADLNKSISDVQVTSEWFSFKSSDQKWVGLFKDVKSLSVNVLPSEHKPYYVQWAESSIHPSFTCWWEQLQDAQLFVDVVMALKFYASKHLLIDDAAAFTDFQEKAKAWLALPQKPALAEEVRRFRVLADDAVQNKNFYDAADYYEKGLAIDPLWPAGQFNAAMIYGELKYYPMAVMHLKRYLALKPDDAPKYQDKLYIWEEKINKENDMSDDSNDQPEQSQRGSR